MKKCVLKPIYSSFYKSKTLCVPVLKIIYFRSYREVCSYEKFFKSQNQRLFDHWRELGYARSI